MGHNGLILLLALALASVAAAARPLEGELAMQLDVCAAAKSEGPSMFLDVSEAVSRGTKRRARSYAMCA